MSMLYSKPSLSSKAPCRETGMVLIIALILLLVLTILGLAAVQSTALEEKMTGNTRNHQMAFQATEAALRAGEDGLKQAIYTNFNNSSGLYEYDANNGNIWESSSNGCLANCVSWSSASSVIAFPNPIPGISQPPVFVIEQMPPQPNPGQNLAQQSYGDTPTIQLFRITALGTGGDSKTQVMLQSTFRP